MGTKDTHDMVPAGHRISPLRWMQKTFIEINNGRRSDIALPRLIDVVIPDDVLSEETFGLSLVDTKGVDQTAVRPDLEARLRDPRTLTVLCTRFNEAPGPTMQRFLEHAGDTSQKESSRSECFCWCFHVLMRRVQ